MDWNGILLPLLQGWLPNVAEPVLVALLGLAVSIVAQVVKPKVPPPSIADQKAGVPTGRPLMVAAPAVAGVILAGLPGIFAGAMGDGLRRAGWVLIDWTRKRLGK